MPLKEVPLESLIFAPKHAKPAGLEVVRKKGTIKTLGTNGGYHVFAAAEFWRRWDKGEFH